MIITTGTSGYSADSFLSSAIPSSTGILRSVMTVWTFDVHAAQRLDAVRGGDHLVAFAAKHRLEHAAHVELVVGDENAF